jgi:hypothetical protein
MADHLITIEIEADSLEVAQRLIKARMGQGAFLLSDEILTHGGRHTARASAETTERAFAVAQARLPVGAEVVEQREIVPAGRRTVTVDAHDDAAAALAARAQLGASETAEPPRLVAAGRRGWLGWGRRPGRYTVDLVQPSIVEVTYKRSARLRAKIGRDLRPAAGRRRLDEAERADQPIDVICDHCGRGCKALPRPIRKASDAAMTPELAIVASRYCEPCNVVLCGACVGVSLQSAAPDFGGRRCPRCGATTEYACVGHLRMTKTIIPDS